MPAKRRRPKAFMKQVVGGIFSSFRHHGQSLDCEVVRRLVRESDSFYDPTMPWRVNQRRRDGAVGVVLAMLKTLLWDRLRVYLVALVNRLMNPDVALSKPDSRSPCYPDESEESTQELMSPVKPRMGPLQQ